MNRKKKLVEAYLLLATDILSIIISYVLAAKIRYNNLKWIINLDVYYMIGICLILFCVLYSFLIDWNREFLIRGSFVELMAVLKYHVFMLGAVGSFLFLMKLSEDFSRLVLGYFTVINLILTLVIRIILKKVLHAYFTAEHNRVKIMVLADDVVFEETIKTLQEKMDINYEIVAAGCLDRNRLGENIAGVKVDIGRENVLDLARQLALDEVFLNLPSEKKEYIGELLRDLKSMGVPCNYNIDFAAGNGVIKVGSFAGYTVTVYEINHVDYRRLFVKRIFDILGGLLGSLLTLIITPFIALFIKLDSPGPVLFSQTRIGKNGRRFRIYKYRSMYTDAEERKKELEEQNEMKGLMFKMENDPRITRVGRFLRKTSIDEFPQFFNILKGDMSLVGTRPPTEDEFEKYNLYYRRRISMTPGLTGLWQVSGRSDIENFDDVVKFDLEYIDKWSLGLDLKIILQTIGVVLFGKGAK